MAALNASDETGIDTPNVATSVQKTKVAVSNISKFSAGVKSIVEQATTTLVKSIQKDMHLLNSTSSLLSTRVFDLEEQLDSSASTTDKGEMEGILSANNAHPEQLHAHSKMCTHQQQLYTAHNLSICRS